MKNRWISSALTLQKIRSTALASLLAIGAVGLMTGCEEEGVGVNGAQDTDPEGPVNGFNGTGPGTMDDPGAIEGDPDTWEDPGTMDDPAIDDPGMEDDTGGGM